MGGNALKKYGINTERKSTEEFLKISNFFKNKIKNELKLETHITKFYRNKKEHGDIDILIRLDKNYDLKEYIQENIKTKAIHQNSEVISFEYNNFQIDFISIKPENWDTARCFFDWDPTGNLMGKTAHVFGLKYGFDGLTMHISGNNSRSKSKIIISKNNKDIFNFLGYDYSRYLKGFNTKKEIFDWVINSKYFDSDMFEFKNLNYIDRKRNKKRTTYNEFLSYIKTIPKKKINFKSKKDYIDYIIDYFPNVNLQFEFNKIKKKDIKIKEINKKFNGDIIMNKYNWLKGEKLGKIMSQFKKNFNDFDKYIINNSVNKIMIDFDNFLTYNKYK